MNRVDVVADSGRAAGLGHLARSSAIAGALVDRGFAVMAHAMGAPAPASFDEVRWERLQDLAGLPAEAAVVVLDSYVAPAEARERLARKTLLAVLNDGGEAPEGARLIVDVGARDRPDERWLCGPRFACLRRPFQRLPPRVVRDEVTAILIATGGGDPGGKGATLAERAARAIPTASVRLLRGPYTQGPAPAGAELVSSPSSTADVLIDSDLVVTAAGQTLLEAAACGTPALLVPSAANQMGNARAMTEAGAARLLGPSGDGLERELQRLTANRELRRRMARAAQAAVDGQGAARVAERLAALASSL
jgi:spore coat polysaccharide biosynthesis predicted glycosyltransferase SpsG